jgi:uncharacterized protein
LRRAIGKAHPRFLGIDDGAFSRDDRFAPVAAVVLSAPAHLEAGRVARVRVDGRDGTAEVVRLARAVGSLDGVHAVLLDGAVVAGFNVLDLDAIHRALERPVIAVTRRRPDFARIRAALEKWFPRSAAERLRLLRRHRLFRVPTGAEPIWAAASGCPSREAVALLRRTMVHGFWPEPLRVAHLVASAAGVASADPTLKGRHRPPASGPVA